MYESRAERVLEPTPPSRVLLLGAGGFIGSAVLARFNTEGVEVRAVARRPEPSVLAGVEWRALDLATLLEPNDWLPHLEGVDVVVNCAGVLQGAESRSVHVDSARALYGACERAAVLRVVLVSAVGVERGAVSEFSATKAAGEQALMATSLDWVVLRPSVVVGRAAYGGTALLRGLAALPVALEFPDTGPLQVVQLDDLVATIVALSRPGAPAHLALDVVGPEPLPFSAVVAMFRQWLRLPSARLWRVPRFIAALSYGLGDFARMLGWRSPAGSIARRELARGAVGDPAAWQTIMGSEPTSLTQALAREPASVQERRFARLYFVKPAVFAVLALFWIGTGLISLGPGWERALEYLRASGASQGLAVTAAIVGALVDIAVGVGIAFRHTARRALFAALAVSVFYLLAGTVVLPQLWLEPLGALLKILPIIVLNVVALGLVEDR